MPTDPHDIVEQIDVVIAGHEDSIKLLKALRTKIAKDRKWKWENGVDGRGMPIRIKVPYRQDAAAAADENSDGAPESSSQNGPGWKHGKKNFGA